MRHVLDLLDPRLIVREPDGFRDGVGGSGFRTSAKVLIAVKWRLWADRPRLEFG